MLPRTILSFLEQTPIITNLLFSLCRWAAVIGEWVNQRWQRKCESWWSGDMWKDQRPAVDGQHQQPQITLNNKIFYPSDIEPY